MKAKIKKSPRTPAEKLRTAQLLVRLTDQEMEIFEGRAQEKGLSMSAWARMVLREVVFRGQEGRGE
jgi:hypothetical protein